MRNNVRTWLASLAFRALCWLFVNKQSGLTPELVKAVQDVERDIRASLRTLEGFFKLIQLVKDSDRQQRQAHGGPDHRWDMSCLSCVSEARTKIQDKFGPEALAEAGHCSLCLKKWAERAELGWASPEREPSGDGINLK